MTDIVYAGNQPASATASTDTVNAAFMHQQLSMLRGTPMQIVMAQRILLSSPVGKLYIEQEKTKALAEVTMAKSMFESDTTAVNAFDEQLKHINAIGI